MHRQMKYMQHISRYATIRVFSLKNGGIFISLRFKVQMTGAFCWSVF